MWPQDDNRDWDNVDDEDDDDSDSDWEEDDESPTTSCPKCGADIYEDAVRCPLCGEYITHAHPVWLGKPLWWKLLGLAGVLALLGTLMMLF